MTGQDKAKAWVDEMEKLLADLPDQYRLEPRLLMIHMYEQLPSDVFQYLELAGLIAEDPRWNGLLGKLKSLSSYLAWSLGPESKT